MERPQVSDQVLLQTIEQLTIAVGKRIEEKGRGAFVSNHEGLGIVAEEYHELIEAIRQNDPIEIANETLDVAVGCVFILASMLEKEDRLKRAKEALDAVVSE